MATSTPTPERLADIRENLATMRSRMQQASARSQVQPAPTCRLVAVSKTKPAADIMAAYECGERHFGENVQELVEKAALLPKDIQWHFIGSLQSNKCKALAAIPNMYAVETVDGKKKADALQKACQGRETPLRVFVQINTSGEESKSGISPAECVDTIKHIQDSCPLLNAVGIMTIGSPDHDPSAGPNPDFMAVKDQLGLDLELSMGMSDDFEHAIELGSTNVRLGSCLFGARAKKATGQ
ncbi:hypothetical protein DFJ73DRAFT_788984 [Zopfochytrium polystomum]|nr:hypothetical protein DFJ73DRAFT_788984 [Zopfochytrium polystomum]